MPIWALLPTSFNYEKPGLAFFELKSLIPKLQTLHVSQVKFCTQCLTIQNVENDSITNFENKFVKKTRFIQDMSEKNTARMSALVSDKY